MNIIVEYGIIDISIFCVVMNGFMFGMVFVIFFKKFDVLVVFIIIFFNEGILW